MENKYQEALNDIQKAFTYSIQGKVNVYGEDVMVEKVSHCMAQSQIDTLQELIDNYNLLSEFMEMDKVIELAKEHKFDRSIFFNSKNLVVNGISYEQLEKALDKACRTMKRYIRIDGLSSTKEDWKEYLFKESEKQWIK